MSVIALDEKDNPVDINLTDKDYLNTGNFKCSVCLSKLYYRMGIINPYFAHNRNNTCKTMKPKGSVKNQLSTFYKNWMELFPKEDTRVNLDCCFYDIVTKKNGEVFALEIRHRRFLGKNIKNKLNYCIKNNIILSWILDIKNHPYSCETITKYEMFHILIFEKKNWVTKFISNNKTIFLDGNHEILFKVVEAFGRCVIFQGVSRKDFLEFLQAKQWIYAIDVTEMTNIDYTQFPDEINELFHLLERLPFETWCNDGMVPPWRKVAIYLVRNFPEIGRRLWLSWIQKKRPNPQINFGKYNGLLVHSLDQTSFETCIRKSEDLQMLMKASIFRDTELEEWWRICRNEKNVKLDYFLRLTADFEAQAGDQSI